jgi:hypothetical protein
VSSGGSLSRSGTTATATTGNGINESSSTLQDVVLYNGQENQKILKMKLGELAFSSLDVARQFGLDWALIELSDRVIARLLEHETFPNFALPRRYVDVVNKDEEVIVVNGYSGVLRGTLSSSPTMIRLPQSNNFQEVWAIRISNALGKYSQIRQHALLTDDSHGRLWGLGPQLRDRGFAWSRRRRPPRWSGCIYHSSIQDIQRSEKALSRR